MVRATSTRVYNPPALPDYLKNVYNLKPIVGAPNDDEVKGIHAVIRAAQTVAQVPGAIGLDLTVSLAQHMFEVQMARYRDRYQCGAFPEDMVHTPPNLPSHVSITLEPVTGAPSDEEIQRVYTAVRTYEQMAVVPSMFDPNVGMELSQHFFNIQFARYMHNAPHEGSTFKFPSACETTNPVEFPRQTVQTRQPLDTLSDVIDEETPETLNEASAGNPGVTQQASTSTHVEWRTGETLLQTVAAESNNRLEKILDILDDVKQVLIRTQQNHAQGTRTCVNASGTYVMPRFEAMNDKGEFPTTQGLPLLPRNGYGSPSVSQLTNEHLARYLQFYDLDRDLVQLGDAPTIEDNKRGGAEDRLLNYLNNRVRLDCDLHAGENQTSPRQSWIP